MNNEELKNLKALADAAPEGPYTWGSKYVAKPICGAYRYMAQCPDGEENTEEWERKAQFFAAASPDVVLALIERIEALAMDAERYKWLRNHGCISAPVKPADMSYDPPEWTDSAVDSVMALEKK